MTIFASSIIGSGSGSLIMPSYYFGAAGLTMKSAAGTAVDSSAAGFWTAIDLSHTDRGYETVKLIGVANTLEQTIVDVTDSGVLTNVVASGLSGAGTMTIRVTIDGAVKTFLSETLASNERFCIGAFLGATGEATAANGAGLGSANDSGYAADPLGAMLTPLQALNLGVNGLKFSTSLKVTIQGSANLTATAQQLNACACYSLSIPEGL